MHCFEYVVDHEYKMSSAPRSDQPSKQKRMKVGHPCTKKKRNKNFKCTAAPFPHDLLVKALNALCNELPV